MKYDFYFDLVLIILIMLCAVKANRHQAAAFGFLAGALSWAFLNKLIDGKYKKQ